LGSNDNVNWYQVQKVSGLSAGNGLTAGSVVPTGTYKNYAFKYFVFIWSNKAADANKHISMGELKLFGHRENDLVRFPDPTNVLKYPHVAMTGQPGTAGNVSDLHHAQRGYEVTASSMYVDNASNPYQPWRAFDSDNGAGWFSRGLTGLYGGTDNAYGSAATANLGTDSGGSATHGGEWLKLKLPRKLVLNRIVMYSSGSEAPEDFTLYGSNDGSSWTEILSETGLGPTTSGGTYTPSSTPSAYRYFGLVIKKTVSRDNYTGIRELKLYGTEEDFDVVARVGDGFDGKIRNLRVYSTALSDARVQEIFDADKDEFGLAKSSVSVYRGHLGVGTDTPKAALTVMDEVAELEEFPPKPMMAAETYMEGHGNFKACASSYYGTDPRLYQPYAGFKRSADVTTNWPLNTWNSISPSYSAATKQVTSGASLGGYAGEWLKLSLPYGVKLGGYQIMIRSNWVDYGPEDWVIVGSNDDTTWHLIASVTAGGIGSSSGDFAVTKDFVVETTKYYKHLALVCSAIHGGATQVNFTGLRYFGTREQGASTLHNGELSLTRNLTVPRIGPPLNADDTPRRDRLVVEYNTSTNPMENAVVKDTSGRGLDGRMVGATYDDTEKALVFDGTDDNLKTTLNSPEMRSLSISGWIKNIDDNTLLELDGGAATSKYVKINMVSGSAPGTGLFIALANGTYLFANNSLTPNTWNHFVFVLNSGPAGSTLSSINHQLYINGVIEFGHGGNAFNAGATANDTTVIDPNATLCIGSTEAGSGYHDGSISNFKLYDVALTADEVKRLYDMGRLRNVIAQPVHIAAPLYAPGTIVQVESSTKSDTFSATGDITHPLSPGNDVPGLSVTIHPKFASSKILISYDVNMGTYGRAYLRIKRTQGGVVTAIEAPLGPADSTTQGKSTSSIAFATTTNTDLYPASFTHYDDANSTTPITYQIQAWTYHSTYYVHINRSRQDHDGATQDSTYWARTLSSITAKEVCQ
jgi:hypothetical protein